MVYKLSQQFIYIAAKHVTIDDYECLTHKYFKQAERTMLLFMVIAIYNLLHQFYNSHDMCYIEVLSK